MAEKENPQTYRRDVLKFQKLTTFNFVKAITIQEFANLTYEASQSGSYYFT